jgi:hypothetical protein
MARGQGLALTCSTVNLITGRTASLSLSGLSWGASMPMPMPMHLLVRCAWRVAAAPVPFKRLADGVRQVRGRWLVWNLSPPHPGNYVYYDYRLVLFSL